MNRRTKKAPATQPSARHARRAEQEKIIALFGTIDYDPAYDCKKQRGRR